MDSTAIIPPAPRLEDAVSALPGIGPKRLAQLGNLGIATVRDLLLHLPRTYEDRSHCTPIADAAEGAPITISAEVASSRSIRLRGNTSMAALTLRDETGEIKATFFGRGFLTTTVFRKGARGFFTGTVSEYNGLCLKNPEYEMLVNDEDNDDRLNAGRIVPIYRLTEGVSQRMLRKIVAAAIGLAAAGLDDPIPERIRAERGLPGIGAALRDAHFPATLDAAATARERFAYEELLAIQTGVLASRRGRADAETGIPHRINGPLLLALGRTLPFALTPAQERAISDILRDMASKRPMARLLQGDVGCGKTIVALHAVAAAADSGRQTALMAPTEILAEQHYLHLRALLEPLGIRVAALSGAMRGAAAVRKQIASGEIHVVAGTQALIQDSTLFHDLGLVIVDEQHRFGVSQRARLLEKGNCPDLLHITATPIPRTLALTVYGNMDLTIIDELPPGRMPVKTRRIPDAKIPGLHDYIREQAAAGFQTYIVCPLVEECETREDLTSAIAHFEELSAGPLAGLRTELLHGRLDASEKDEVMRRFKAREIDVLFSTTVIEVGIDVATATTMVVENSGQFGLTQLHQLRGRVGRGPYPSYCFLLGAPRTDEGAKRLEILCRCSSGFDIAEEDLVLRGPGEFTGVRQAGMSDLRAADLVRDARLLDRARRDAEAILDADAGLDAPEHQALAQLAGKYGWVRV